MKSFTTKFQQIYNFIICYQTFQKIMTYRKNLYTKYIIRIFLICFCHNKEKTMNIVLTSLFMEFDVYNLIAITCSIWDGNMGLVEPPTNLNPYDYD